MANTQQRQTRVAQWESDVAKAISAFEARWTRMGLRAVAPAVADMLEKQAQLYREARIRGSTTDFIRHAGGMWRGYREASAVMQAYLDQGGETVLCQSLDRKTIVLVAEDKGAQARADVAFGEGRVVQITPTELAELFGSVASLQAVADVKRRFPGAEILKVKQKNSPLIQPN